MSELLNKVNWIDIFALILLIRISYVSSFIGVGKQILPLILLVLILSGTLYSHSIVSPFLIEWHFFSPPVSRFLSYFLILGAFFIIYRVLSQIAGFHLFSREGDKAGFIENIGGTFLGLLRSILIIGMIMIGLGFAPVRGIESAIRDSYSGIFFIKTNLTIYNSVISFILRGNKKAHLKKTEEILSEKEKYIFDWLNVRRESRFFKDTY